MQSNNISNQMWEIVYEICLYYIIMSSAHENIMCMIIFFKLNNSSVYEK